MAEPAVVLGNAAVTPTKFLFSNDHCKLLFAILNTTQAAIVFSDPTFSASFVSTIAELGILQDQNFACYTAGNRRHRIVLSESDVEDLHLTSKMGTLLQCAWLQRGNGNN